MTIVNNWPELSSAELSEAGAYVAADTPAVTIPEPRDSLGSAKEWMKEGLCYGAGEQAGIFFPNDGVGAEAASRICATCVVQTPCLEYALERRIEHGVWGGASERERRRILRQRARLARSALRDDIAVKATEIFDNPG